MRYLLGCLHYGHDRIRHLCNRPFQSVEQMNDELVKNINSIRFEDTLYLLGDVAWHGFEKAFWDRVQRKCVVIFGNHDDKTWYENQKLIGASCPEFCEYLEIPIDQPGYKGKIVLSHYPMEVWNGKHKGWFMAYSHTHRDLDSDLGLRRMHVGADTIGFKPISIPDFIHKIEFRNLAAIEREIANASK